MKDTFIYGDKIQHHCYFEKTMNLRWYHYNCVIKKLQQASKCISCGKIEWNDIHTIKEGDLNEN